MTIEELRRCLNVPEGTYKDSTDNLKKRVINSSIKEINEKTAYKVEYENVKDGRKIVGFKFKLHLPSELSSSNFTYHLNSKSRSRRRRHRKH